MGDAWTKPYSREYAAFPASWLRTAKFWPSTGMPFHLTIYALSIASTTSAFLNYLHNCFFHMCIMHFLLLMKHDSGDCYQGVLTMCTVTATSSAPFSQLHITPRKRPQLLLSLHDCALWCKVSGRTWKLKQLSLWSCLYINLSIHSLYAPMQLLTLLPLINWG